MGQEIKRECEIDTEALHLLRQLWDDTEWRIDCKGGLYSWVLIDVDGEQVGWQVAHGFATPQESLADFKRTLRELLAQ